MNRNITNKINWILDNLVPPILRDSKFFMGFLFRIALGKKYKYYFKFKDDLSKLNETEINDYYNLLGDTFINRETDLNNQCIEQILSDISKDDVKIFDGACGSGYLLKMINAKHTDKQLFGLDIIADRKTEDGINYFNGSITSLPFDDAYFDVVICTHALEHIKELNKAITELRRVTKNKLIIVLPKQREYMFTFDLHINFFPYKYSVERLFSGNIKQFDNDFYILELKSNIMTVDS